MIIAKGQVTFVAGSSWCTDYFNSISVPNNQIIQHLQT